MGHKAVETACTISKVFGPRTATECTVYWFFKTFCKGDNNLKVRKVVGGYPKLTMKN